MPIRAEKVEGEAAKSSSILKELVALLFEDPKIGEAGNKAGLAFKKALVKRR